MTYKFIYFCLCSVVCVFSVQAQEFDVKKAVQEKLSEPDINEMLDNSFDVSDVNSDGYISENEFGYLVNSVDIDLNLQKSEKAQKKARLREYFKQFDKNGDSRLSKDEYMALLQKETEYEAQERIKKMQDMANKSPQEMINDLNEKMEKNKIALDKFNSMSTEELSNKFINNISNNIAEENYFQMDKDKDGCVTEDEYAEYMVVFAKNTDSFTEDNLSKDDWRELYQDEKKAKENCLTKEEYVRNYLETPDMSVVESDTAASELLTDKKVVK